MLPFHRPGPRPFKDGHPAADPADNMSLRLTPRRVLTAVAGAMAVAPGALAAVPAPRPTPPPAPAPALTATAPVTTTPAPAPVAAPAPAPTATSPATTPVTPDAPAVHRAPPRSPFAWAAPARAALARDGLWDAADDLGRDATRRDLARALHALAPRATGGSAPLPTDVAAQDPAAGAISVAVARRWMQAPGGAFAPDAPVSARTAQTTVLRVLGLRPSLAGLARIGTADGARFATPPGFPAAVLARELRLRHNYPAADEALERPDAAPIRVADLVAMTDRARSLDLFARSAAARYRSIRLPVMSDAQRTVVQAAFTQVGMPYIWGGDWPTGSSPWGYQAQGGFDCSGLVWMAFKGDQRSAAAGLGDDLVGRTADAMAFEAPRERVALSAVAPGDLVFFGDRGMRTARGDISHVGMALGGRWMVHSSGSRAGVTISSLATYWTTGQARARRPAPFGTPPQMTSAERRGLRR